MNDRTAKDADMKYTKLFLGMAGRKGSHRGAAGGKGTAAAAAGNIMSGRTEERKDGRKEGGKEGRKEGREKGSKVIS
jgi:hypothetical protein